MVPIALTQTAQRSQSQSPTAHTSQRSVWLWAAPGAARPGGRPLCELSHLE